MQLPYFRGFINRDLSQLPFQNSHLPTYLSMFMRMVCTPSQLTASTELQGMDLRVLSGRHQPAVLAHASCFLCAEESNQIGTTHTVSEKGEGKKSTSSNSRFSRSTTSYQALYWLLLLFFVKHYLLEEKKIHHGTAFCFDWVDRREERRIPFSEIHWRHYHLFPFDSINPIWFRSIPLKDEYINVYLLDKIRSSSAGFDDSEEEAIKLFNLGAEKAVEFLNTFDWEAYKKV